MVYTRSHGIDASFPPLKLNGHLSGTQLKWHSVCRVGHSSSLLRTVSQRLTHNAIQRLLLKRFALAAGTYALALLLLWLAFFTGHYDESLSNVAIGSALVVISQAALFAVFYSGCNLRFSDPSLTEAQVLLGLGWQTWLIAHLDEARGAFWCSTC